MAHSKLYVKLMNSREWKELRVRKIQANPLCERCMALHQWVVPAQCVHHVVPVESGRTDAECRELAFRFNNLQSLCFNCHHEIHKADGYHKKDVVLERQQERQVRWEDQMKQKFGQMAATEGSDGKPPGLV